MFVDDEASRSSLQRSEMFVDTVGQMVELRWKLNMRLLWSRTSRGESILQTCGSYRSHKPSSRANINKPRDFTLDPLLNTDLTD